MPLIPRLLRRAASAAATVLFATAVSTAPASAQNVGSDVFLGVTKDDVKAIVVFVFSDSASPSYDAVDRMALYADPDYVQDGQFNPFEACVWTFDFPNDIDPRFQTAPIYGPNAAQDTIDPFSLPSYMARETVEILQAENVVTDQAEIVRYFNCTGFVWSLVLQQPEEVWREIIDNLRSQANQ